ncbi:hypothetical protein F4777DRAFT_571584 [Nemania sp. FL0916]|nr:hypothetical protein F4777DRAFT_571584 [Nemania sp. FL0916]
MAHKPISSGCLSDEEHDHNITNPLVHLIGCITIQRRDTVFHEDDAIWKAEMEYRAKQSEQEQGKDPGTAVREMIQRWKSNFDSEMKRINILRKTLSQTQYDKHLVEDVVQCRRAWRDTAPRDTDPLDTSLSSAPKKRKRYTPEKDVSVPVIQFKDREGFTDGNLGGKFPNQKIKINQLLGKAKSKPKHKPKSNLLYRESSPAEGCVKYFHIPSNNMIWIEQAIARYYGDERPDFDAIRRHLQQPQKTRTSMILQEKYWRGRLHGDKGFSPHARYMSHTCETISSSTGKPDRDPKNMVLFMPYLHWETSKRQKEFAVEMDMIVRHSAEKIKKEEVEAKRKRQSKRNPQHSSEASSATREEPRSLEPSLSPRSLQSLQSLQPPQSPQSPQFPKSPQSPQSPGSPQSTASLQSPEPPGSPQSSQSEGHTEDQAEDFPMVVDNVLHHTSGPFRNKNRVACYLLAAARLYERMTTYRDRMLLRKYLMHDAPIHPRRTLDQSYYWTLKSTKKMDKDQVVFRGTTVMSDAFHRYNVKTGKWPDHEKSKQSDHDQQNDSDVMPKNQAGEQIKNGCDICRNNIRHVPRVVMVDQLWMWILDAHTLITCFPKRYGANKQDYSGVHKSVRTNLENLGPGQIRTVFELALIVLDECTTTFFDRAESLDGRPQVIDEFRRAIVNIMHRRGRAFKKLWHWTDEARDVFRSGGYSDTRKLHISLLDINPEGKLDQEISDIKEELDIMLQISNIHKQTIGSFIEQAERMLDPRGELRKLFDRNCRKSSKKLYKNPGKHDDQTSDNKEKGADSKNDDYTPEYKDYESFKLRAYELQDRVNRHVEDLESLRKDAKDTADGVMHLLTMKQQQASVAQAWHAGRQSDETVKQGRSILVFTLATIVFLPLSFLTSVFGMNNKEFGDSNWGLGTQLLYIFTISAGVVSVSLLFAFYARVRAMLWALYAEVSTEFLITTGIYTYITKQKRVDEIFDQTYKKTKHRKNEKRKEIRLDEAKKMRVAKREKENESKEQNAADQPEEPQTHTNGITAKKSDQLSWVPPFLRRRFNKNPKNCDSAVQLQNLGRAPSTDPEQGMANPGPNQTQ